VRPAGAKKAQMPACDPSAASLKLEPSNFKLDLPYDPSAAIRSTFTMALRPNAQNPSAANYAESTTRKKSVTGSHRQYNPGMRWVSISLLTYSSNRPFKGCFSNRRRNAYEISGEFVKAILMQ
jgi:hypothetical protein